MPQNRQYYRKTKYPYKVTKPKHLVFVRIFLFCSVGIKIQYFPTAPLKMKAAEGKMRLTDVADMKGIFRIIQSIPSPNAESFKLWLAEGGKDRIDEIIDPELTIDRFLETYLKKGYKKRKQPDGWIYM